MYQLEIRDSSNQVLKTYAQEGVYISDVLVDSNMVTLNRLTRNENTYTTAAQDYITSNEERKKE